MRASVEYRTAECRTPNGEGSVSASRVPPVPSSFDLPCSIFDVQKKTINPTDYRHIRKGSILYWLNKPFPVYLIFYDDNKDSCYWYSVEENRYDLLDKLLTTDNKTIYISAKRDQILKKGENTLFKAQFEQDYHSLMTYKGTPTFIGREYVKSIPMAPRTQNEYKRIKGNARACLYSLIHYHLSNDDNVKAIPLLESVSLFDRSHYNHFAWLGYVYKDRGDERKALANFKEAVAICKRDKKWDKNAMATIIERLEKEIETLRG